MMTNIRRLVRIGLILSLLPAALVFAAPAGSPALTNALKSASAAGILIPVAFSNGMTNASSRTGAAKPLTVERADSLEYLRFESLDEDIIRLSGSIVLDYGSTRLKADQIAVNMLTRTVYGRGHVQIRETGRTLIGEGFFYDLRRERGIVYQGASVIDQLLYRGEEIKTLDTDFYRITDGLFSTCKYERPHYFIEAKKLWIYPDKSLLLLHLFYRTGGVRIFYFPFAYKPKKGDKINTFVGYSEIKGYYIQNTYHFNAGRHIKGNLMADYYEFLGPFVGIQMKGAVKGSFTEASLNYALQRTLNEEDGTYDSLSRWLGSVRETLTIGKESSGITTLQGYYVNAGDNYFSSDYLYGRNVQSGLGLFGLDKYQKAAPGFYVNQNTRYLNISHTRDNFSATIGNSWTLYWNDAEGKYITTSVSLPSLSGSFTGKLVSFKVSTNASFGEKVLDIFANKYSWQVKASMYNKEYFDRNNGSYLKTEQSHNLSLGLVKTFNFFNYFIYSPQMSIGNVDFSGKNLSLYESKNFKLKSYSYFQWNEGWGINPLAFWKKPVVLMSFGLSRSYSAEILRPDFRQLTEYGDLRSHSMSLSWNLNVRPRNPDVIPTLGYSLGTTADLMTKTNERLDLFEPGRYGSLQQNLTVSLGSWLSARESWFYNLKKDRSTLSETSGDLTFGRFRIGTMKFDGLSANISWINNFENARQNYLTAGYSLSFSPLPYLSLSIGVDSKNDNLLVYDRTAMDKFHYAASEYRNFFSDLADSFNFLDIEKRKKSNFKLQGISVSFTHDLHCWELKGGYSLRQAFISVPSLRYAHYPYWEHSLWIQINLKAYQDLRYIEQNTTTPPTVK